MKIAQILRPVGVKGEVRAKALSDGAWRYDDIAEYYLCKGDSCRAVTISYSFAPDGFMRIRIEGVGNRDAAEALRNSYICIRRDQAPGLPANEYYHSDLLQCEVYAQGEYMGKLESILGTNGASDVYVVRTQSGRMLFPAISRVIRRVDIEGRRMELDAQALSEVAVYED